MLSVGLKLSPLALITYTYCSTDKIKDDPNGTGLNEFKGFKNR